MQQLLKKYSRLLVKCSSCSRKYSRLLVKCSSRLESVFLYGVSLDSKLTVLFRQYEVPDLRASREPCAAFASLRLRELWIALGSCCGLILKQLLHFTKSLLYFLKQLLHFTKSLLHFIKSLLHFVKKLLHFTRSLLYFLKKLLHFTRSLLYCLAAMQRNTGTLARGRGVLFTVG